MLGPVVSNSESLCKGKWAFLLKKKTEFSAGGAVLEQDLRVEFVLKHGAGKGLS